MTSQRSPKYGHIVTVGTSLFTNAATYQKMEGGSQNRNEALQKLQRACCSLKTHKVCNSPATHARNEAKDALLKLDPCAEFKYRPPQRNRPRDRLPQELSCLWKFAISHYLGESPKAPVRLLSSDTDESKNCALILSMVLNEPPWKDWYAPIFRLKQDFAEGVNAEHGDRFRGSGIQRWMEKLQQMIKQLEEAGCDRIFLNVTGGYKGTVPYSTLMGMLHSESVTIAYLFEESTEIIYIPAYPVGLDFRQWHENALRLRMATEPNRFPYYNPDRPLRELLQEADRKLSAFGLALEEQYNEQLKTDPLKFYSGNIITRLLHDDGPWVGGEKLNDSADPPRDWQWERREVGSLRGILHDLVEKSGDIIWLGDKLPEMVEHAQRHHHNLLEFTELFLTPILYRKPHFLNARERFVLLSAIMLHDSGHSLDRISLSQCKDLKHLFGDVTVENLPDEIPLFPNDVRDYHQYLAAIRLNDEEMAGDLGWPGRKGLSEKGFPEDLHDAVLLACLYHRRRMDYHKDTSQQKGKLHLTGQLPGPLLERKNCFQKRCQIDLMKVVALLRLIDGCDSQARRAGPRARVDLTVSLLDRDYQTAAIRAWQASLAFREGPSCHDKNCLQDKLAESPHWHLQDSDRQARIWCLQKVQAGCTDSGVKQCARLWLIAAEAADRAQMRYGQFEHFLKHRAVEKIEVLPADNFHEEKFWFHIILVPDRSNECIANPRNRSQKKAVKDWLKEPFEDNKTLKQIIEREVSSEYADISDYADTNYGITASYWWEDEWEKRENGGRPFYPTPEQ